MRFPTLYKIILLLCFFGLLTGGCSKKTMEKSAQPAVGQNQMAVAVPRADDNAVKELLAGLKDKGPIKGNLTPEKAAEITNAVAKVSLAEIPSRDLPKDPKVMIEINDRIRKKSDDIYSQYGTTMGDVMRYISDLAPQEREKYNKKLTDLFLEESKKHVDSEPVKKAEPKPEVSKPVQKKALPKPATKTAP